MRITSIPQIYRHLNRWYEIVAVLIKYELAAWIGRLGPDFAKDILKTPSKTAIARHRWETRLRMALSELGPTFIKLGQILSTRPDLVGVTLAEELQSLQADAPADPPAAIRKLIEAELGRKIEEIFDDFEDVADGLGLDRAGASRGVEKRRKSRRQSASCGYRNENSPSIWTFSPGSRNWPR